MAYVYQASPTFWKVFYKELSNSQKESTREAWKIFKKDPFDPRLGTHKIHALSALKKETVYSVVIESDLRSIFVIRGNLVYTLDIGTHNVYK